MDVLRGLILGPLREAIHSLGVEDESWVKMLVPSREKSQGDLSLPCFAFAKKVGKSPNDIADILSSKIKGEFQVSSKNGYLNFSADSQWLASKVMSGINANGGKKVLIEHTSANPNGPFHVGRARNAILGDTLVRLNRLYGNDVTAEYYVDDMGKQVGVLAWALENLSDEEVEYILQDQEGVNVKWLDKKDHVTVRYYQAAQLLRKQSENSDIEDEIGRLVHASENGDNTVLDQFEKAYKPVLDGMLETLSRLGISFDTFTRESKFVVDGTVSALMDEFESLDIHGVAKNGAHYLDLGQRGLKGKTEFYYRRGDG